MSPTPSKPDNPFAQMIQSARKIVAFTGAGISTAAGIPDFRGPNGLYATGAYDPDLVFEIGYFRKHPEMFYRFSFDFIALLKTIQPTFTHYFLARLEKEGRLRGIITQNIDALHHRAGSARIIEVHGSFWRAACIECSRFRKEKATLEWWDKAMTESPRAPVVVCPHCSGVVKPDVVFYNEPVKGMELAESWVRDCDLLLVLGSSLTVFPAAFLPQLCRSPILIVNKGEVSFAPDRNHIFIREDLDIFFKNIADYIDSQL
ncbi:Sir2 family NAD-dependent protein deacetylase [bacterium]|nr:Sir2 family NAD-dependent protein deacetylase [bacterium]